MTSGFEMTSTILTPCQAHSDQFKSVVLCSQIASPCGSPSALVHVGGGGGGGGA